MVSLETIPTICEWFLSKIGCRSYGISKFFRTKVFDGHKHVQICIFPCKDNFAGKTIPKGYHRKGIVETIPTVFEWFLSEIGY